MEFRILGALDVIKDDRPLTVRSGKQQALLALLLCQAGKVVRSDALVDALWGDEAGEQGVKRLRLHLHRLRRTLGSPEAIVHRAQGYALDIPTGSLDAHRFENLAHQGRQALASGLVERASDLLHTALALWRGPALSGLEGAPLLNQEATRLNEERLSALGDCMDADLRLRRHTDLIGRLSVLVEEHPFQERFRGQLMLALYRAGRQGRGPGGLPRGQAHPQHGPRPRTRRRTTPAGACHSHQRRLTDGLHAHHENGPHEAAAHPLPPLLTFAAS